MMTIKDVRKYKADDKKVKNLEPTPKMLKITVRKARPVAVECYSWSTSRKKESFDRPTGYKMSAQACLLNFSLLNFNFMMDRARRYAFTWSGNTLFPNH